MPDQLPTLPAESQLAQQTHEYAQQLYADVGQRYLDFRRQYCEDPDPNLATVPPRTEAIQQTESARLAAAALRAVPKDIRGVSVLKDILDHLQWEVDIHTLTERERLDLHNITMTFLYGVNDGIQPWYVEWMLGAAHRLADMPHPDYYLMFPWHGLYYRSPRDLAVFDAAVGAGALPGIQQEVGRLAENLAKVLREPLTAQPELAFSGPDSETRRTLFTLKTAAGLALGAYLGATLAHDLFTPRRPTGQPQSVLPALPAQLAAHIVPEGPAAS